ncbi:MAG: hypothetical protein HY928_07035 [Elusimicrobia bacterium]|nr:hypothetical protein [Elusimicrobiota bacterium]
MITAALLSLFLAVPAGAQTGAAAKRLLAGVSAPLSSGTAVLIAPVEDTTGRSAPAAAALKADLLLEALDPARGWTVHETAPDGPHVVMNARITADEAGLRAVLFLRRSTATEILAGASAVLGAESAPEPVVPAAAPAAAGGTAQQRLRLLWDGHKPGERRRWEAFGGALYRTDPGQAVALLGAALRSPSGRFELVLDGGRFKLASYEEAREGTNIVSRHREMKTTFFRLRPVLRAPLGRMPWCGFERCPLAVVEGGLGTAFFDIHARSDTQLQSLLGGPIGSRPDEEGTFWRIAPFAVAGLTLELNRRLELGLQAEYVVAGADINGNPYGGAAAGARLTLLFP